MAEQIITKRCCSCKQFKSLSEFHKDCHKKDGYRSDCKTCQCEYQRKRNKTETRKIYMRHYNQGEKGKAANRRYRQNKRYKVTHEQYYSRHTERCYARTAVQKAIKAGRLPQVKTLKCSCGNQAEHYHHHKGYAKEHWLDVIPVCTKCHGKIPNSHKALQAT